MLIEICHIYAVFNVNWTKNNCESIIQVLSHILRSQQRAVQEGTSPSPSLNFNFKSIPFCCDWHKAVGCPKYWFLKLPGMETGTVFSFLFILFFCFFSFMQSGGGNFLYSKAEEGSPPGENSLTELINYSDLDSDVSHDQLANDDLSESLSWNIHMVFFLWCSG